MRCRGLIALLIWGQSVAAADLGTWGDLWPVKEPDMLTVIMQRLTALEQSGEMGRKMDAFKERVIRNSLRPPAVPGIGRTEKYGSRLFDPSVRLAADICWSCIFPLSLGSIKVSQGKVPDTANPSMPIQICPAPPPLFRRIGLAIGYWEPMALTDVTRSPGCMVNLGFSLPAFGKTAQGTAKKDEKQVNGAFYHVHWYKYPLTYWLNIITSLGCLEGGDLDIAYLSEIDPTWTDSSLTTILNPEAVIFANPIAQGACAADAIASAFNMPLDVLFWCAGSQGSMYPFNGWVSNESSPLQSSLLVSERMAFKLHRQGMIMETIGKNNAVCNEYPSPILPKERWRYQMVNMYPDSGQCHPFGRSVMRWETGKNPPNTKKNFGYLMWRKRNCVFL